jgi:hypothetical protein
MAIWRGLALSIIQEQENCMSTFIIDGTIEEAVVSRRNAKLAVFKSVTFAKRDGSRQSVEKAVVTGAMIDEIKVGNSGRFYWVKSLDIGGFHGLRKDDGTAIQAFPGETNLKIFLYCGLLTFAMNILWIIIDGKISLLSAIVTLGCVVAYVLTRKARNEALAHFSAES